VEERTLCGQPVAVVAQTGRFEQAQSTHDATSLLAFVEHNDQAQFAWILAQGEAPEATADQVFNSLDCH